MLSVFDDIWAELAKNFWKEDKDVLKQTLEKISPKLDYLAKFIG